MKIYSVFIDGKPRFLSRQDGVAKITKAESLVEAAMAVDYEPFDGHSTQAPLVSPSKIVCVGRNYADHASELGNQVPPEPLLFFKAPSAMVASDSPIRLPAQSSQVEHEGELAIVIGREACDIADSDPVERYILGYTCLNDVTARDLQIKDGQFARAKSFDSFCPVGPCIETELDPSEVRVSVRVNGETRQHGLTSQMIFDIPYLLRYISRQMTLFPGDIIATGTPSGVSKLNPGDLCEVEIEGIGTLRNPVINKFD